MISSDIILVVEDNDEDFDMIRRGFVKAGVTAFIERACDVSSARAFLDRMGMPPRIVLLDLNMPGASGHTLLDTLKADPKYRATPVVILSTSQHQDEVDRCYGAGANSFHSKPLETPKFYAMMQDIARYWFQHARLLGHNGGGVMA